MSERPADLPDFRKPPIDEVAVAVQFAPIEGFTSQHIQRFWRTVRDDFPLQEKRPRVDIPLETSGPQAPPNQIQQPAAAQGRAWLISESDDYLIQVQDSTFVQNWRRREAEYEHFEAVRDRFWKNFRKFREFLGNNDLAVPRTQQVEVTYINWIDKKLSSTFVRPMALSVVPIGNAPSEPEDFNWIARYLMSDSTDLFERLYLQFASAFRAADPTQVGTQFTLIVRAARAAGIEDDEASRLIDAARRTIVKVFTELTTPAAHEAWEKFQ